MYRGMSILFVITEKLDSQPDYPSNRGIVYLCATVWMNLGNSEKTSQRNIGKFQNVRRFFKERFLIKPLSLNTLPLENFTVKGRDLYR